MYIIKTTKSTPQLSKSNNSDCFIDWSLFDRIFCIHYLPYVERLPKITSELKRIGILDSSQFEFWYTTPNSYYYNILNSDRILKNELNPNNINLAINFYNILQQSKYLNYNRILIIEDDEVFLEDVNLLKQYIDEFPMDADIVNMDPQIFITHDIDEPNIRTEQIVSTSKYMLFQNDGINVDKKLCNASFVGLSKNAINTILQQNEIMLAPTDSYISDKFYDSKLKIYVSNINLGTQNR